MAGGGTIYSVNLWDNPYFFPIHCSFFRVDCILGSNLESVKAEAGQNLINFILRNSTGWLSACKAI